MGRELKEWALDNQSFLTQRGFTPHDHEKVLFWLSVYSVPGQKRVIPTHEHDPTRLKNANCRVEEILAFG